MLLPVALIRSSLTPWSREIRKTLAKVVVASGHPYLALTIIDIILC